MIKDSEEIWNLLTLDKKRVVSSRYEIQYPISKAKFFDEDKETGEIVGYDIPQQLPNNEIERIRSLLSCIFCYLVGERAKNVYSSLG